VNPINSTTYAGYAAIGYAGSLPCQVSATFSPTSVPVGSTSTLTISGGTAPYTVTEADGNCTFAAQNPPANSTWTATAVNAGTCDPTVTDHNGTGASGAPTLAATQGVTTFAGNGGAGELDSSTPLNAEFDGPDGIAEDSSGNIYVADSFGPSVRKIAAGGAVTTLASNGGFSRPHGLTVDAAGNVYMADLLTNIIYKITPGGSVSNYAGNGTGAYLDAPSGPATAAEFYGPAALTIDASGNIYVAEYYGNRIRKISTTGAVTTVAGNGTAAFLDQPVGPATSAEFDNPFGITIDAGGNNLYVSDFYDYRIRKISLVNGDVTTVAGNGTAGWADAPLGGSSATMTAEFNIPTDVAIDTNGNLYVTDSGNARIRKISPSGVVSTIAGNGTNGFFDNVNALNAEFYSPAKLLVTANGIYIADSGNNRIRLIH
jgi:DNA-binding beta-propeller fold protein YncE